MNKPRLLIIAHTNLGDSLSGGDRIFLNIIRYWKKYFDITSLASFEAKKLIARHHHQCATIATSKSPSKIELNTLNLFFHHFQRFFTGLVFCIRHRHLLGDSDYIYTSSDFYGDFIFGLMAKLHKPQIKWLCGFYLMAPFPLSPSSPYIQNRQPTRGLIYYIAQIPTKFIANKLADFVMVTSTPDTLAFPNKSIIVQGGVYIPSQSKIKQLPAINHRLYDGFYLGRLHSQKGVLEMIDIWKLVCQQLPSAKLIIVGDGELMPNIKQKISTYHLQKNITLVGFLIGTKKFDLIKNSKVVLHPATYDSGGMAAAEAMAWGLPGVSFDLPALKSYYPAGMVKIPPYDFNLFASAVIKLLTDPKYYHQLSQEARSLTINSWSWPKRLQNIYHQII